MVGKKLSNVLDNLCHIFFDYISFFMKCFVLQNSNFETLLEILKMYLITDVKIHDSKLDF
jgi:hypothetical protein